MSITWGPSLFPHFSPISRLLFWTPWRMLTSLLKGYATVWWWDMEWKNCCKCGDAFWQCPCRSFFKELPVLWESFFFFLTSLLKLHFLIAIFLKSSMLFASSKESTVTITLSSLSCFSLILGVESRQLLLFLSKGRHVPRTSWGGVCSCIVDVETLSAQARCPGYLSLWSGGHIQEWSTPFYDISLGLITHTKYLCLLKSMEVFEYLTNLDETGLVIFHFQLKFEK